MPQGIIIGINVLISQCDNEARTEQVGECRVVCITRVFQPVGIFNLYVGNRVPAGISSNSLVQMRVLFKGHETMYELSSGRMTEQAVLVDLVPGFSLHVTEYSLDHGKRPLLFGKSLVLFEHVAFDIFTGGIIFLWKFQSNGNNFLAPKILHPRCQVIVGVSSGSG